MSIDQKGSIIMLRCSEEFRDLVTKRAAEMSKQFGFKVGMSDVIRMCVQSQIGTNAKDIHLLAEDVNA